MFRARGCTAEEAADLAQDAAVRAYVHIRRWGVNGTGLDPLLNRIARNLLIDRYRRTTPHIVPLDDAGELQDPDQDPTEEVARRQRTRAVRTAIQDLPARHQAAITYSLSGLSPEEVGRQMGIGRNAADALLHRARRSLKERLQTVGEGMFGFAFGIRLKIQGIARRVGLEGGTGDAATSALASSALGVAVATMVAVFAVTGGGGTSGGGSLGAGDGGFAGIVAAQEAASLGQTTAPAAAVNATTGSGAASGSSANTYSFGSAKGSLGRNGTDNTATVDVPGDPHEEPLLEIRGYVLRRPATESTQGPVDAFGTGLCRLGLELCGA